MEGILYVAHGTRLKQGVEEAKLFVSELNNHLPIQIQEIAFLEFQTPTMEDACEQLIQKGVTTIYLFPLLLFAAGHAKDDIPKIIAKVRRKYPHITIYNMGVLGVSAELAQIVANRVKVNHLDNRETEWILIGRGSKDPYAYRDFLKMKEKIAKRLQVNLTVSFLAAHPIRVEEAVRQAKKEGKRQIVLIPYLLFSGRLMKRLEKLQREEQSSKCMITLCPSIGYHRHFATLFQKRLEEKREEIFLFQTFIS